MKTDGAKKQNKKRNAKFMRVLKVPVRIVSKTDDGKLIRSRIIEMLMDESRKLANQAIIRTLWWKQTGVGDLKQKRDLSKSASIQSLVYDEFKDKRQWIPSGSLASLLRLAVSKACKGFLNVLRGIGGFPSFMSPFFTLRCQGTVIKKMGTNYDIIPGGCSLTAMGVTNDSIKGIFIEDIIKMEKCIAGVEGKRAEGKSKIKNPDKYIEKIRSEIKEKQALIGRMDSGWDVVAEMGNSLILRTRLSKRDKGKYKSVSTVLDRIIAKPVILGDSKLELEDGEYLLLLSYESGPRESASLDPNVVMGIDMGINTPIVWAIKGSKKRGYIGYGKDVDDIRWKYRAIRRRRNKLKGLMSKTKMWESSDAEIKCIRYLFHCWARRLQKDAVYHHVGVVYAEDLSSLFGKLLDEKRLGSGLSRMLLQYCKNALIEVGVNWIEGNARNSSNRCSKCGFTSKRNRNRCLHCGGEKEEGKSCCEVCRKSIKAGDFKCVRCGCTCNADYNAAVNIANWTSREIEHGYDLDDIAVPVSDKIGEVDKTDEIEDNLVGVTIDDVNKTVLARVG